MREHNSKCFIINIISRLPELISYGDLPIAKLTDVRKNLQVSGETQNHIIADDLHHCGKSKEALKLVVSCAYLLH